MSVIDIANLTFAYDGSYDFVFEDVSVRLDSDWKLGLVGRNGRGKTTLLRLLMGDYDYRGKISSYVAFSYFPYPVEDPSQDTVTVAYTVNPMLELWMLERELSLLGVSEDVLYRPFTTLSNGEQTKVLLAILFSKEETFLLIDEPTNHLDVAGRQLLARYLDRKKGFILVSHDRTVLDLCTDHTMSVNRNRIDVQSGNFSVWYENKQRRDAFELAQNRKLKKEIYRLEQAAQQSARWADRVESSKIGGDVREMKSMGARAYQGEQSRRMQQRRKNLERRQDAAIAEKKSLLQDLEETESLQLHPEPYHSKQIFACRDFSLYYGEKQVFLPQTFSIAQGDRVAVCGSNGCGKSTLLSWLNGTQIASQGDFRRGSGLKISYVCQDSSHLQGRLDDYVRAYGIDGVLFRAILRKLDFSRVQFEKDMAAYSAGQKKKVLLARSLCERAHLWLWDEPLNYIDLFSRVQIEDLLLQSGATVVFVEHDAAFTEKVATKKILL